MVVSHSSGDSLEISCLDTELLEMEDDATCLCPGLYRRILRHTMAKV
jgi:hypothetical protein